MIAGAQQASKDGQELEQELEQNIIQCREDSEAGPTQRLQAAQPVEWQSYHWLMSCLIVSDRTECSFVDAWYTQL